MKLLGAEFGELPLEPEPAEFDAIAGDGRWATGLRFVLQELLHSRREGYGLRTMTTEGEFSEEAFGLCTSLGERQNVRMKSADGDQAAIAAVLQHEGFCSSLAYPEREAFERGVEMKLLPLRRGLHRANERVR